MRLVYGSPPESLDARLRRISEAIAQMPEERARELRMIGERHAFGKALFNLLAPLSGEEPIP